VLNTRTQNGRAGCSPTRINSQCSDERRAKPGQLRILQTPVKNFVGALARRKRKRAIIEVGRKIDEVFVDADLQHASHGVGTPAFAD